MSGVKGRSGRRKSPKNLMKYLTETIDSNSYVLVDALVNKAKQGDKDALFYLFDRRLGKPVQQTDLNLQGGEDIGVNLILKLAEMQKAYLREAENEANLLIEAHPQGLLKEYKA